MMIASRNKVASRQAYIYIYYVRRGVGKYRGRGRDVHYYYLLLQEERSCAKGLQVNADETSTASLCKAGDAHFSAKCDYKPIEQDVGVPNAKEKRGRGVKG